MSMNRETWEYFDFQFATPCPKCGGRLIHGEWYDWPPQYGGNYEGEIIKCENCKHEWVNPIDHWEYTYPDGCVDDMDRFIGWTTDGRYINGCEGPIKPGDK